MRLDSLHTLIEREGLPGSYGDTVERWWRPLAKRIVDEVRRVGRPLLVGINGSQGSGKSTMALFLEHMLQDDFGLNTAVLSLDDLYLTQQERQSLAVKVHPLLATRGVPGTHDVELGQRVIEQALTGSGPLPLPRFDKSTDDRAMGNSWPTIQAPLDILLFEGWCLAARPVPAEELEDPINALEAVNDSTGRWRNYVNAQLAGPYRDLFGSLDLTVMLRAPDFDQVVQWRLLQERKLIQRTGKGMDKGEVRHFIMHYERLTRQMLENLPPFMDVVFDIGADHDPVSVTGLELTASPTE